MKFLSGLFSFLIVTFSHAALADSWNALENGSLGRAGGFASERFCQAKAYPAVSGSDPVAMMQKSFEPCYIIGSRSNLPAALGLKSAIIAPPGNKWAIEITGENVIQKDIVTKIEKYLDNNPVTSLIFMLDGQIILERYQYDRQPEMMIQTFGVDNLLMPIIAGIALQEGKISSFDIPVSNYLPYLENSGWDDVTLFHLLRSSSGIRFDPKKDRGKLIGPLFSGSRELDEIIKEFTEASAPPGEEFTNSMLDSYVLSRAFEMIFAKPINEIIAEKVWGEIGAEHQAAIMQNSSGEIFRKNFFSASGRDYLKLGWLLINNGKSQSGKQLIPSDWASLVLQGNDELFACPFGPNCKKMPFGYSFHNYVAKSGVSISLGLNGNMLAMSPQDNMVLFHSTVASDNKGNAKFFEVVKAVVGGKEKIRANILDNNSSKVERAEIILEAEPPANPSDNQNNETDTAPNIKNPTMPQAPTAPEGSVPSKLSMLEEIESRCKNYGFENGSKEFGNCVFKLLDLLKR